MVTLDLIAVTDAKMLKNPLILDTLCNGAQAQTSTHLDDSPNNRCIPRICFNVADKRLVNLQFINGESL